MKYDSIAKLYKSGQTVFSMIDLATIWSISNNDTLKTKIFYLINTAKIKRLYKGIFCLDDNYNKYELSGKLKNPSYVSLETVFRNESMIFQYSEEISSIGNSNKNYYINNTRFSYRKIKDSVLFCNQGIIQKENYAIATKERALLDMMYLNKSYYFDNISKIDWQKCRDLLKIYDNKQLEKRLESLIKKYA